LNNVNIITNTKIIPYENIDSIIKQKEIELKNLIAVKNSSSEVKSHNNMNNNFNTNTNLNINANFNNDNLNNLLREYDQKIIESLPQNEENENIIIDTNLNNNNIIENVNRNVHNTQDNIRNIVNNRQNPNLKSNRKSNLKLPNEANINPYLKNPPQSARVLKNVPQKPTKLTINPIINPTINPTINTNIVLFKNKLGNNLNEHKLNAYTYANIVKENQQKEGYVGNKRNLSESQQKE